MWDMECGMDIILYGQTTHTIDMVHTIVQCPDVNVFLQFQHKPKLADYFIFRVHTM